MGQDSVDKASRGTAAPFIMRHFGWWLVVAMLVGNLAVVAFCAFSLQNSRAHAEHLAQVQTQNLAQAADQGISNSVDKFNQSLRTVVFEAEKQLAFGKYDMTLLRRVIEHQKKQLPEAIGLRIVDADGNGVLGHSETRNPGAYMADRDNFVHLKQTPGSGIAYSRMQISRYTGDPVLMIAHRINHPDGRFAGAALLPISVSYFKALLSRYEVGQKGILAMRDQDLQLIMRFPDVIEVEKIEGRTSAASEPLRELVGRGQTISTYYTVGRLDQIMRVVTFRKLSNMPVYVLAGLAEEEYLVRWRRELWETVTFALIFALVTGCTGWLLLRTWRRQAQDASALHESHRDLKMALWELNERDRALSATQEAGGLGIYKLNFETGTFSASVELDNILGIGPNDLHSISSWEGLIHPEDLHRIRGHLYEQVVANKQSFNQEYRIIRPLDGDIRWLHGFGTLEFNEAGQPLHMRGTILDVTERKRDEEQLRLAHEVFINTREAVIVTDENINIINVNPAFSDMTGFRSEEVIGKNPRMLLHHASQIEHEDPDYSAMRAALMTSGYWEGETKCCRKDGTIYIQATKITAVRYGQGRPMRFIAVASDVTQLRASQNQIEHLAYHDKLTDLPNRVMLADRLQMAISQAERREELLGVCYLDLDGFKEINDVWGHDIGDEVLVEIAERLQSCIRAGDTVARLGGDEFVVLLGNILHVGEIEQAIRRILATIAQPVKVTYTEARLTASIGVAIYPDDVVDADMLIRRADQAMYVAKRSGKNQFHLFDSEADRKLQAQRDLSQRVVLGMKNNEFQLHYQPKVDMRTGKVIGAEALIRWRHPERGFLMPMEFLPVVENTELSIRVGEWVIAQALRQMEEWSAAGLELPVSVNISGFHLQRPDFVQRLSGLLAGYPEVNPAWLQLEILETIAMEDVEAVSVIITSCAQLGVSFALDDFGTGYSSLTYFRRLPTQLMKIDRSFVRDMLNDAEDYALIESIVRLAQSFKRQVIAEGVETIEQGLSLMQMGCDLAQGYCIAQPMPPEAIPGWLREWVMPQAWRDMAQQLQIPKQ